jgi:hypothetical protein
MPAYSSFTRALVEIKLQVCTALLEPIKMNIVFICCDHHYWWIYGLTIFVSSLQDTNIRFTSSLAAHNKLGMSVSDHLMLDVWREHWVKHGLDTIFLCTFPVCS